MCGSGSGKTTIAQIISDRLNQIEQESAIIIPMDRWHTLVQMHLIAKSGQEGIEQRGAQWTLHHLTRRVPATNDAVALM